MLKRFSKLLHDISACNNQGSSHSAAQPSLAILAILQKLDLGSLSFSRGDALLDGSVDRQQSSSAWVSSSAEPPAQCTPSTSYGAQLKSGDPAVRSVFASLLPDSHSRMAGTAHFNSRGQRGQHRAASTTSGGPDSPGDAQADQQQSAEVTSEILEADTPAETPEELDMDGSDLFRAFLESNPTGEPLNPELRGERMWEPFADVDLSDLPEVHYPPDSYFKTCINLQMSVLAYGPACQIICPMR